MFQPGTSSLKAAPHVASRLRSHSRFYVGVIGTLVGLRVKQLCLLRILHLQASR